MALLRPLDAAQSVPLRFRLLPGAAFALAVLYLATHVPAARYRWSEEVLARQEISQFLREDEAISRAWHDILEEGMRRGASFDELAGRVDQAVAAPYEQSFEQLSRLNAPPALPSAAAVETLRRDGPRSRRDASRALAEGLRTRDSRKIQDALELARGAGSARRSETGSRGPKADSDSPSGRLLQESRFAEQPGFSRFFVFQTV